jgi:hypothetical protein
MPFCFDECPISLSECIGSCLPVVTNEYAGFDKKVINTFGCCAEYKNVRDYADALIRMLTDSGFNRSKRRGCQTMIETFTFHQFKENLNRVFEKFGEA